MCDKAKWSFPVLRSGVVLRTRERAPSCSVVCGPEEDSWTRSLTVSLLNGPLFPLAKWSRRAADQRSRGGQSAAVAGSPQGGWTARCPKGRLEDRSETGVLFRGAARGRQGKAAAVRPRGPGRRASAGGPREASQSRRLWRRQRGRALPTLSADDNSVNSTSVETHLQLKTTPRSARRTRGRGASESRLAETRTGSCVFKLHLEAGGTESGHGRSVDVAGTRRARVGDPREPASWLSLPSRERPQVPGSVCGCFRPRGAGPLSERTYWILTCFPFCDFSDPEICFLFQRLSQNS